MHSSGYTVIDFETTGLFPHRHDRIVELAVVYVSPQGEIQGEWDSLIHPQRDLGATEIHGITGADVMSAPTFDRLAPYLLRAVTGRTIVAHNARFDVAFLEHEFERVGAALNPDTPALCTMEWSMQFIPSASRKLTDCCAAAGVPLTRAHTAAGDAQATAQLLAYYLRATGNPPPWSTVIEAASRHPWPSYNGDLPEVRMVSRSTAAESRPESWMDRATSRVERSDNPSVESYLDVLERALLDGHLSAHEKEDLTTVAISLGLHREQLEKVHRVYLTALAAAAWTDGVVTDTERRQFNHVAEALGVPREEAAEILEATAGNPAPFELATLTLSPGDRVAFTGELLRPREDWVERVAALGINHGTVTKAARAVVAADPDSLSGKASKAREYGIPIITETAFEEIITKMEQRKRSRSSAIFG